MDTETTIITPTNQNEQTIDMCIFYNISKLIDFNRYRSLAFVRNFLRLNANWSDVIYFRVPECSFSKRKLNLKNVEHIC